MRQEREIKRVHVPINMYNRAISVSTEKIYLSAMKPTDGLFTGVDH